MTFSLLSRRNSDTAKDPVQHIHGAVEDVGINSTLRQSLWPEFFYVTALCNQYPLQMQVQQHFSKPYNDVLHS